MQNLLAETSTNFGLNSNEVKYITDILLNNLLVQIYAVEVLGYKNGCRTPGADGKVLNNTFASKLELLKEIKKYRNRKPAPLKRIYINNNQKEKRPINIPSVIDRGIQILFFLVLDPIIESHSDHHSFGFRKGRNSIMAVGAVQKFLQRKYSDCSNSLENIYI